MKYFRNNHLIKYFPKKIILVLTASVLLGGCIPTAGVNKPQLKPEGEFRTGAVVAGFPNLPSYPKSKIIESYGSNNSYGVSLTTDAPLAKVFEFYNGGFSQLGWEAVAHRKTDTNIVFDVKNSKYAGQVIINTAADGKMTAITMAVSQR